jgi:hypothetical protein
MKPILKPIFTLLISINLMACTTHVKTGDGSHEVNKNGSEVSETRQVTAFNKIEMDGVFNVYLRQGDTESLIIEADKAVAAHIISEVKNETLKLKMEDDTDFGDIEPVKIYVQVRDLQSLSNKGVGTIKCEQALKLDQFMLSSEGVGAIDLTLSANRLVVKSETVGAITLAGKVTEVDITHNGVGVLQAFELLTRNLKLSSNGVGAAEVYASESIDIEAKGVGSVQYKGNPKTKNIVSEGIGKVAAVD